MGKSVLTLETIEPDRDYITIDGKQYSLRNGDELGMADSSKLGRLALEIVEKGKSMMAVADPAAGERIEGAMNETLAIIVINLPDEVRDKLRSAQKTSIVEAFTAVASKRRAEKATGEQESQKTSEGSSPGSSDSTSTEASTPG